MNLKNLMSGILRNLLSFVLMVTVCFAGTVTFAFTANELDFKFLESQKELKAGAQHVQATVTKKGKLEHRLEFFRYTDLDEIIPSLNFEKDPNKFVKDNYENFFNIVEKCCTVISAFAGAGLGWIFGKWVDKEGKKNSASKLTKPESSPKPVEKNEKKLGLLTRIKNLSIPILLALASVFTFGGFMKSLSNFCSDTFMRDKLEKLKIEKRNALYAMRLLLDYIEDWQESDSIFIQIDCNPDYYKGLASFITSEIEYSKEDKELFPQAFEKLKKELKRILENNKEDYNYEN